MPVWLIPACVFLLIGIAGTAYLYAVRVPREETAAGIAALADMRWRDFIRLVLEALQQRGFSRVFDADTVGDEADIELQRDDQPWLLSCKHGVSFVLDGNHVAALVHAMRMRGAAGGVLVTPGRVAPGTEALATPQRVELLDGPRLWPQLRPLLDAERRAAIGAQARARAARHVLLAWLLALFAAIVTWQLLQAYGSASSAANAPAAASATAVPGHTDVSHTGVGAATNAISAAPTDPAALERRRQQAAHEISALPGVQRALWSTESTLLVSLQSETGDPKPALCTILKRYDELASSRVQLQPPEGSAAAVRFFQCRSY